MTPRPWGLTSDPTPTPEAPLPTTPVRTGLGLDGRTDGTDWTGTPAVMPEHVTHARQLCTHTEAPFVAYFTPHLLLFIPPPPTCAATAGGGGSGDEQDKQSGRPQEQEQREEKRAHQKPPPLPVRLLKTVSAAAGRATRPLIRPDKPSWSLRGRADLHQQLRVELPAERTHSHLLQEAAWGGVS